MALEKNDFVREINPMNTIQTSLVSYNNVGLSYDFARKSKQNSAKNH